MEYDDEQQEEDFTITNLQGPMIPQKVSHFSVRSPINTKIDKKRPSGIPFSTLPKSNHFNISRIASGTSYEKIVKMAKISTVERMI
jgi:hypothetical protein